MVAGIHIRRPNQWPAAAHARRLLVVLVCLGAILAIPLTRPAGLGAPGGTAAALKPGGLLSPRLTMLTHADWAAAQRSATMQALHMPTEGYGSLLLDRAGTPLVYIRLAGISSATLAALASAGARIIHSSDRYGVVTAAVAPDQMTAVAQVPGVVAMQEALAPGVREQGAPSMRQGSAPAAEPQPATCPSGALVSEGDTQLRAARARAQFGVDGSGVTVGVLSGSYDVATATGVRAADDIASGDLPGPGNPCGYTTPVQVAAETRIGAGRDEGRAMLQVVHDLAPGATLAFATASDGLYAFADNIRRLRAIARADIIVDDYYYPEEPFFQDGPINTAIHEVTQDGAVYVTAGGNIHAVDEDGRPIGSYEAPAYRPTACPTLTDVTGQVVALGIDCHDFDPRDQANPLLAMTLPPGGILALNLQWSEPWFGVATDLDIFLVDAQQQILAQSLNGLSQSPFEFLGYQNATNAAQVVKLVVARVSGASPRFKFTVGSAALTTPTISHMAYADVRSDDLFGPTVTDHSLSIDVISVGAALYSDARRPAPFSSHGPAVVYWAPVESVRAALPLAEPSTRAKPDIMAISGVRTTFLGRARLDAPPCAPRDPANAVCRFFGTSAAAPHIAGVLALMKQRAYQRDVALGQAQAQQLLAQTAQQMRGTPAARGAGLADALNAVAAVDRLPATAGIAPQQLPMPELVGLSEQQAREVLIRQGVAAAQIVSDYQDRAKLGELFDQTPPFHVVSTLPRAGEVVDPGSTVVLGVRAPDPPLSKPGS
jgi:hypothetical protein